MGAGDLVRAHVRISGRVQAVGFRFATLEQASAAGARGWVRNLDSGDVEVVFEGSRTVVERLVAWCWEGPSGAYVRSVQVIWDEPMEGLWDFSVKPTGYGA